MKRLIALLLCLIPILSLAACGFPVASATEKNRVIWARVDDEDIATLLCGSGKALKIRDAKEAFVTRDRKTAVWISTDGSLNCVPFKEEKTDFTKREKLAEKVEDLVAVSDKGFCFYNEDEELFRVLFADKAVFKVSEEPDAFTSTANADLFYAIDGKVFFLPHDSEDAQKIATSENDVEFWTISEDTAELIWADSSSRAGKDTVYYFDGKDNVKLCQMNNSGYGSSIIVESTLSGDYVAVYSYSDSILMLKAPGKEFVKVDLKAGVESGIYSKDGLLNETNSSKLDGVYVAASQDDLESVYWVTFDGDREKVLSKIVKFGVSQGSLYYLDEEMTLYQAKAAGITIGKEEKITTEVDDFVVSNGYLYYMKDTEEASDLTLGGTGTLYVCTPRSSEPTRIASDVYADHYTFYSRPNHTYCRVWIADNGKTVLYLKNPEEHSYAVYGSLFRYTVGAKEPERIMGDVREYSFYGPKTKLHSDCLFFGRYIDEEASEKDRLFDWYFYDGKNAVCFARKAS